MGGKWKAAVNSIYDDTSCVAVVNTRPQDGDFAEAIVAAGNRADLIVRAVNAHDALVGALKVTARMYESATGLPMPSQAYRALLLAKHGAGHTAAPRSSQVEHA